MPNDLSKFQPRKASQRSKSALILAQLVVVMLGLSQLPPNLSTTIGWIVCAAVGMIVIVRQFGSNG